MTALVQTDKVVGDVTDSAPPALELTVAPLPKEMPPLDGWIFSAPFTASIVELSAMLKPALMKVKPLMAFVWLQVNFPWKTRAVAVVSDGVPLATMYGSQY